MFRRIITGVDTRSVLRSSNKNQQRGNRRASSCVAGHACSLDCQTAGGFPASLGRDRTAAQRTREWCLSVCSVFTRVLMVLAHLRASSNHRRHSRVHAPNLPVRRRVDPRSLRRVPHYHSLRAGQTQDLQTIIRRQRTIDSILWVPWQEAAAAASAVMAAATSGSRYCEVAERGNRRDKSVYTRQVKYSSSRTETQVDHNENRKITTHTIRGYFHISKVYRTQGQH